MTLKITEYQAEMKEKNYNLLLKKLRKTCGLLLQESRAHVSKHASTEEARGKKIEEWLHNNVTLMQTTIDLQALLPAESIAGHCINQREVTTELNGMKDQREKL